VTLKVKVGQRFPLRIVLEVWHAVNNFFQNCLFKSSAIDQRALRTKRQWRQRFVNLSAVSIHSPFTLIVKKDSEFAHNYQNCARSNPSIDTKLQQILLYKSFTYSKSFVTLNGLLLAKTRFKRFAIFCFVTERSLCLLLVKRRAISNDAEWD